MRKYFEVLGVVGLLVFSGNAFAQDSEWEEIGKGNMDVTALLVHPGNSRLLYMAAKNNIFKTEDGCESWRNIFSLPGQHQEINFLAFNPQDYNSLYVATGNGLWYGSCLNKSWKRLFIGKNSLANECTAIAVLPPSIYLGTKAGLFLSRDEGRSWYKMMNGCVLALDCNPKEQNYVYAVSEGGVFQSKDNGQTWERIFVASDVQESRPEKEEPSVYDEEPQDDSVMRCFTIALDNTHQIYLGTSRGVYRSDDKGSSWVRVSDSGLIKREVRFLLGSEKTGLFAAGKSGIYRFARERWDELSTGLVGGEIKFLCSDNEQNLYAACVNGLFRSKDLYALNLRKNGQAESSTSEDEPLINAVQKAAIDYADVAPEKINRWRRQAAHRALLPRVSVGMDHDNDRTISNSIWGTYSSSGSPGRYFTGPDDETQYNNNNWSITLTWELGDLIWSNDQNNIDVRSRLMVELRNDVLDEVTKLYFERLRTKMELENLSLEDRKKRAEKELRLKELTASLDALTGGYFSQHIKRI